MKFRETASFAALAVALGLMPAPALAESAEAAAGESGDVIIVTGTRTLGMNAADSPAPVQILTSQNLESTGSPDLMQTLAQSLPTIQAQAFGSDLQAHNLQMKLRGLSPNHTLILINGKRRHGTANVSIAGGPYGGSAAPDMSFIPAAAIGHIEVLQDGAAAQYGTDAIAGVINIILKDNDYGGALSGTAGQYMDEGGDTYSLSANFGFAPIEDSYFNVTVQKKKKGFSFRGDVDPRVYGDNPVAASNLAKYPDVVNQDHYPYVNRIMGDPEIEQTTVMYNAGYRFGDFDLYSFGSYGHKYARAYENYRTPGIVVAADGTPFYPTGFSPLEAVRETDYSVTGGIKGMFGDLGFDLASTYGDDFVGVYVENSANASLYADTGFTPTEFHDGDFKATQWTNTLDLTYPLEIGLPEPVNIAAGLEWRRETYGIVDGDPASYYGSGAQSFFGYAPENAGSHHRTNFSQYLDISFKPTEAWLVDGAMRHEHYSDFGDTTVFKLTSRYDISDSFAVRGTVSTGFRAPTLAEGFYSGISVGPNSVGGVLPANSAAAASLGFGGLKPEKSTNFSAGIVFNPTPRLTMTLDAYWIDIRDRIMITSSFYGFYGKYCPEDYAGTNAASCVAYNEDTYNIYNQQAVYDAVSSALGGSIPSYVLLTDGQRNMDGTVRIQTFANGADMRTRGVDFTANYELPTDIGMIDLSLTANYNENKVKSVADLPSALYTSTVDPAATAIINKYTVWQLEKSTPKFRAALNAHLESDRFSVNLRESYYSRVSALETTPGNSPLAGADLVVPVKAAFITDAEIGYKVTEGIKLSIGANNLFNKYPTKRSYENIRAAQLASGSASYGTNVYPTISPYGINGGYYYGRVNLTF
ncbi:TonB-dependent receptor plug domain-containing protein [Sphingopyxis indica]|uniref:Iron complex outermembrane recepter protein n=1 Tax=Sphingopyxis indica TaxID=436663 RepID=A0A239D3J6_9SPHN|nr:TonB-dependent receptor [Sphingopyxis indica]SNS27086.1 iron complex outermembrane recepter protein [Sphingopyxis indica]